MKLLDPRTIQVKANVERKNDIDQGMELARKIDALRVKLSEEESRMRTFESVTRKEILDGIAKAMKEKGALEDEVSALKTRREILLIPLDKQQKKIDLEEEELKLKQKETNIIEATSVEKQKKLDKLISALAAEQQRMREMKEGIERKRAETMEAHQQAEAILNSAVEEESRVHLELEQERGKVEEKTAVLLATINDIEIREREVLRGEEFVSEEIMRLKDQRATLERAMKRLKT